MKRVGDVVYASRKDEVGETLAFIGLTEDQMFELFLRTLSVDEDDEDDEEEEISMVEYISRVLKEDYGITLILED